MSDSLKKYIQSNRSEFDIHSPKEESWNKLANALQVNKSNTIKVGSKDYFRKVFILCCAACILLFAFIFIFFIFKNVNFKNSEPVSMDIQNQVIDDAGAEKISISKARILTQREITKKDEKSKNIYFAKVKRKAHLLQLVQPLDNNFSELTEKTNIDIQNQQQQSEVERTMAELPFSPSQILIPIIGDDSYSIPARTFQFITNVETPREELANPTQGHTSSLWSFIFKKTKDISKNIIDIQQLSAQDQNLLAIHIKTNLLEFEKNLKITNTLLK